MEFKQKKSAVDLTELAMGIVILGMVVSIGATVLTNVANTQITNAPTYQVANETLTGPVTSVALSTTWVKSVDVVLNETNGYVINSGNYSLNVNSNTGIGTITNTTGTFADDWKVSYTVYNTSDPRFATANNASVGLAEYGNWFKILVIVGIAAVVLSLIFMAFGRRAEEGGVSY